MTTYVSNGVKLTKYEHACFSVEYDGQTIVVDPGNFTTDYIPDDSTVAVFVTHQHPDHLDHEQLAAIFEKNDNVWIYGPAEVINSIEIQNKKAVDPGEIISIGPFHIECFGGVHELIHESIPRVQNIGILINELIYYPGDSFVNPERPVDVLALPVYAPWLRLGSAIDLMLAIRPRYAFPTHDAPLNTLGTTMLDRMVSNVASNAGIVYERLDNTKTIAI